MKQRSQGLALRCTQFCSRLYKRERYLRPSQLLKSKREYEREIENLFLINLKFMFSSHY